MFNKCIALAIGVGCTMAFAQQKSANYDESKFVKIDGKTYGLCGKRAYDPKEKFCFESEGVIFDLCGGKPYNPSKEKCENGKVSSSTAMMIDKRDMKVYKTVTIGTQTWMAENLNYDDANASPNLKSGNWCYDGHEKNCEIYGRLYTWAAAMDLESKYDNENAGELIKDKHRGICPEGWHLPNDDEWNTLFRAVGGTSTAGTKLKSTSGWSDGGNGTDSYGFSVLPAGSRSSDGSFYFAGNFANFWSSSEYVSNYAYNWYFGYDGDYVYRSHDSKYCGFSVRCLRDS